MVSHPVSVLLIAPCKFLNEVTLYGFFFGVAASVVKMGDLGQFKTDSKSFGLAMVRPIYLIGQFDYVPIHSLDQFDPLFNLFLNFKLI